MANWIKVSQPGLIAYDSLTLDNELCIMVTRYRADSPTVTVRLQQNGITRMKKDINAPNDEQARQAGLRVVRNYLHNLMLEAQREEDIVKKAISDTQTTGEYYDN